MALEPSPVTTLQAAFPDDGDVATVYRAAAGMVAAGGVACLLQSTGNPHLGPSEVRGARVLGATCIAAGVAGAATTRTGGMVARVLRKHPPATLATGLAMTAANPLLGGARSPAIFISGIAVAIGGGVLDAKHASLYGALAGGAWFAQSRLAQALSPGRPQPDQMYVECALPLQMVANAVIGSVVGAGALATRSLQHSLHRLEANVDDLDKSRKALERAQRPFLDALADFASAGASADDPIRGAHVEEAAARSRDRLDDVSAAMDAARRASDPEQTPIETLVDRVARSRVDVKRLGSSEGTRLSPRAQLAAHVVILRALNNARRHGTGGITTIGLGRLAGSQLRVEIRSPAVGVKDGIPRPGRGTRDSQAQVRSVGGSFEQFARADEFVVGATIPITDTPHLAAHRNVGAELLSRVERAAWAQLRVNGAMVLAMSWAGKRYVGPRRRSAVLSTLLLLAAERVRVAKPARRKGRLEALLAATALVEAISPHGNSVPLGGWGGMLLTIHALQDEPRRVMLHGLALAIGAASSFRGTHGAFAETTGRDGIAVVLPAVVARFASRGFGRVAGRERRLARLIEELEQLQDVAENVAFVSHGFAEPVDNALGLLGNDPAAVRLAAATQDLRDAGTELSRALGDRKQLVAELADALAYRMWPSKVEIRNEAQDSRIVQTTGIVRQVAARRRVLESMASAADHILEKLEPDCLGRWPLEAVELTVTDAEDDLLLVSITPRPRNVIGPRPLDQLSETLAALGGTVREGFDDGRLTFTIALTENNTTH